MATLTRRPLEGKRSLPQLMSLGSPATRLPVRSLSSATKRPRSPDALLDSQQSLNAKRPRPVPPSPSVLPAPQEEDPKPKEKKRAEREAQKEEFRVKYTRAFPKFSFYLHWDVSEGDPDARERLQARINYMDARVEDFFSKDNITHFITNLPIPQDDSVTSNNKENILTSTSRSLKSPIRLKGRHIEDLPTANDGRLLIKAVEWKMKIWTVAKLESVLDRCQAPVNPELSRTGPTASAPPTLSRLLQSERLHGTTERDPNEKRLGLHYFSKNSYFILVEDLNDEVATIHALEYPIKKGRDGKEFGDWPVLYCHPRARGPFIEFDRNEARRAERAERQEGAREQERIQRMTKLREQELQKKMRADRLLAKRAGDLRRSVSMVNLHRRLSIGDSRPPPQNFVDHDIEAGDSANASGYLASGYMAASGNSIAITSAAGTTSTSGLSTRGVVQMPSALRERLQQQIVTSRKVGLGNNAQKEHEEDNKGDMGPPSAIPERKLLRKSKSTNTMKLPKREETTKPGYCECCRMKFDDFQEHIVHRKHRKFATNPENFIQLDYLLERVRRQDSEGGRR
ncbi:Dfp1/Him1, central region-domain-containing protein [Russula earlei]|uniref:Dfp1/Him1, central region-domain-containing protein n=1 Tax=Russula earlei TaxID=71964 RepID=A0ACC0UDP8_9AGAM|nr:Dfp1/Him1, central region-domain-containing protein [Russula earlei]